MQLRSFVLWSLTLTSLAACVDGETPCDSEECELEEVSQDLAIGNPVAAISITSISPQTAAPGTVVTINGTGFDRLLGGYVQFGSLSNPAARATRTYHSATRLTTVVPAGAVAGRLYVTNLFGGAQATSAQTFTPLLPPAAPSNLIATASTESEIRLQWSDNSNNETGFDVWISDATGWHSIGIVGPNDTSEPIENLWPGSTYPFKVRAQNAQGFSEFSNVVMATTFALPTITITNSSGIPSPLTAGNVPTAAMSNATSGFDANHDGFVTGSQNADPNNTSSLFPVWVPQSGPSFGRILPGSRFASTADLVVGVWFDTSPARNRPQFVVVHFRINGNTVVNGPMLAGDLSGFNPNVLFSISPVSSNLTVQYSNGAPSRVTGSIRGTPVASDSIGTTYGSQVDLTIDLPIQGV